MLLLLLGYNSQYDVDIFAVYMVVDAHWLLQGFIRHSSLEGDICVEFTSRINSYETLRTMD